MSGIGIIFFVFMLIFAIAFHEFGHFAFAKLFGMKVDKFYIGFGKPLWSVRRGETEYGIAAIPVGGYVRIAGMSPDEVVAPEDRDRVFKAKPAWQRAIVLVAGSATHFLQAFILAALILMIAGLPDKPTATIDTVQSGSPAGQAGFKHGDKIVAVNGAPTADWDASRDTIRSLPDRNVVFNILRDGRPLSLTAHLGSKNDKGENVGFLGVGPVFTNKTFGPLDAFGRSGSILGHSIWDSYKAIGSIVSPHTLARLFSVATGSAKRTLNDPASIVGISRQAGNLAGHGRFADLFFLIVGFNIFIGVANLLPLPPLDGGHLAVLGYESIRRKSVDVRKLVPVSVVVVGVLLLLFVLSLYLDIVKPLPGIPG